MNGRVRLSAVLVCVATLELGLSQWTFGDESETDNRLTLADLVHYRAALAGKATADSFQSDAAPARVSFRDLWDHAGSFRGRRVTIQGRISRIFRQGPVGSFPPLSEVWITSPAGDPFCVICPQPELEFAADRTLEHVPAAIVGGAAVPVRLNSQPTGRTSIPAPGRTVRFTGTFLKLVRYEAGDGGRLAPLIVGAQQPLPLAGDAETSRSTAVGLAGATSPIDRSSRVGIGIEILFWAIGLVFGGLGAAILARWYWMRRSSATRPYGTASFVADPPLEFIDSDELPRT